MSLWKKYRVAKNKIKDSPFYPFFRFLLNLFLAFAAVIPLMITIWDRVPFTYEVNDDAALVQILDGSYTGIPNAHSIFVRYPLSLLIRTLYVKNPVFPFAGRISQTGNWYIIVLAGLETLAMVCVLFRILNAFSCNRLLLCFLFDMAFVSCWLPHYFQMTFSTAGAFLACMSMLFMAFVRREEAWRPWNLVLFGIMLGSAFCLRKQCAYMVLPFIAVIVVVKYHIHFFRSVKAWFASMYILCLVGALFVIDGQTYGSQEWKQYLLYNHARAYLQDYAGFPDYEEDKDFYRSMAVNQAGRDAMANYTYCMVEGFEPDQVLQIYAHVKEKEKKETWKEKIRIGRKKVVELFGSQENAGKSLAGYAVFFWQLLLPLFILTLLSCWKKGVGIHFLNLVQIAVMALLTYGEWVYLAINDRFPARVEETIWLLTFCVGFLLVGTILLSWRDNPFVRLPGVLQVLILVIALGTFPFDRPVDRVRGIQQAQLDQTSAKQEVLAYCGRHPDRYYVLDTMSFTQPSRPDDDLHQGNWIMSGSWTAFSPVYYDKLEPLKSENLGPDFLLRENVYLVTKGAKNISAMMGFDESQAVEKEIVDEIITSNNTFYEIYKVKRVHEKD